jgi:hypothetical protein
MLSEKLSFKINTNVKIADKQTGEILVDQSNAIHPQHFALIFARGLANANYWNIHGLVLGNGGSYIDTAGNIIYNTPNTTGNNAVLYNNTWLETITGLNTVTAVPSNIDLTSSVVVSVTLGATTGGAIQYPSDTSDINNPANPVTAGTNTNNGIGTTGSDFNFDELGLIVQNPLYGQVGQPRYLLMTHLIFSPIQKNANRELLITYTLTVAVS